MYQYVRYQWSNQHRLIFYSGKSFYKVASPGKTAQQKHNRCWTCNFIPAPSRSPENASIMWPVQENTSKTIVYLGLATLYTRSIPLLRAENASIKWSVQVKPPKKTTVDVGLATLYPFHPAPPSRESPVQVKHLKKQRWCWSGHFIHAPSRCQSR